MTNPLMASSIDGNEYPVNGELKWRPSVYGIIIQDDKVLLSPQFGIGHDLPGGGMELEETAEQALIREVKEETGYDVEVVKFADMRENFFVWHPIDSTHHKFYHSICLYYVCKIIGGELSTIGFDKAEKKYAQLAEWIECDEFNDKTPIASTIDFRPVVLKVIKELKK